MEGAISAAFLYLLSIPIVAVYSLYVFFFDENSNDFDRRLAGAVGALHLAGVGMFSWAWAFDAAP